MTVIPEGHWPKMVLELYNANMFVFNVSRVKYIYAKLKVCFVKLLLLGRPKAKP